MLLFKTFLSLLIALLAGFIVFVAIAVIGCLIWPPYTKDGYGTMPIGQALLATVISIPFGFWMLYILLKKFVKLKWKSN